MSDATMERDATVEVEDEGLDIRGLRKATAGYSLMPLGLLFTLNFVDEFDRIAFAALTPEIRDAFDLSDTGITAVAAVTSVFALLAALPLGILADRFDRVVSAELSFEMLKLAAGEPGEAMQADGAHLPVPDRSVDAVVLVNMFLFPDEVHRVLAESGCVLWVNSSGESTPIHLSPDEVASALPGRWRVVTARAGIGLWAVLRRS